MPPTINCQKSFIQQLNDINKRLDGRYKDEYRNISITFGLENGCCQVQLGNTKILASVSCTISQPAINSFEGKLKIDIISPFNTRDFDKRNTSEAIEVRRVLEKTIKDSRCLNSESLCLVADEKIWEIHLNITILNNDGNTIDCSCIAAITALSHFRLPQVSISGTELTVHPTDQKPPVPLSFNHRPYSVTFAYFDDDKAAPPHPPHGSRVHRSDRRRSSFLLDPNGIEDCNSDGRLTVAINLYKEVCCVQTTGQVTRIDTRTVMKYCSRAFDKAKMIEGLVKEALAVDESRRKALKKLMVLEPDVLNPGLKIMPLAANEPRQELGGIMGNDSDEAEDTLKRWIMRNFQHLPPPVDMGLAGKRSKDDDDLLENRFDQSLTLDNNQNDLKRKKDGGTSALGIIDKSSSALSTQHHKIKNKENKERAMGQVVNDELGDQIVSSKSGPRPYTNSWHIEIPDLAEMEKASAARKNKKRKSGDQKNGSLLGEDRLGIANVNPNLKGLNFRIGKVEDSEHEEGGMSEEEPVLMEMTDFELEERFNPKLKVKKKKKKTKDDEDD